MSRVAVVTDSASDLPPARAHAAGIAVVPLEVNFGSERLRAGIDLSTDAFWERMLAPGAPFPTTAAASPGDFRDTFEGCLADGASAVVCVTVGEKLSGAIKSARIAREMLADREIRVVDSASASMGEGLLALLGAELSAAGASAQEIAETLTARARDLDFYVALDSLEYLRRGGRISGAQAAIGNLLSFKPIITIREGAVEAADRVRTRGKARERTIELLTARPIEALAILYTPPAEAGTYRDEVVARLPNPLPADRVSVQPVGASVGPHIGPGCLGGVVLNRA
ncbi:MAG TPA: DegV family protein [Candidatus Limnocylindrales bacterium]